MYFDCFKKSSDNFVGTVHANSLEEALEYAHEFCGEVCYGSLVLAWEEEDLI